MRPITAVLIAVVLALAAAAPASAARGWQAPLPLDPAIGSDFASTSAAIGGTTSTVAWPSGGTVFVARVPGGPVTPLGAGGSPSVRAGDDGTAVVTWTGAGTGHVAVVAPSGAISQTDLGAVEEVYGIRAAVDAAGDVAVAYVPAGGATTVSRYRAAGGDFAPAVDLGSGWPQAMGLGAGGRMVLVRNSTVVRQTAGGDPTADEALPANAFGRIYDSDIAVDAEGNAGLVHETTTFDSPSVLGVALGTPDGEWRDAGVTGSPDVQAVLRTDDAGHAVLAWTETSAPFVARLRLLTGDLSGAGFAPAAGDGAAARSVTAAPLVAVAPGGSARVAWEAFPEVHTLGREGTGAFEGPQTIGCQIGAKALAVGVDAAGAGRLLLPHTGVSMTFLADDPATPVKPEWCPAGGGSVPPAGQPGGAGVGGVAGPVGPTGVKPSLTVARNQKLKIVLRKGLKLALVVPQAGTPTVTLGLSRKQARKLKLGRKALTVATKALDLKAGANAVTVPIARKVRRKLGKAKRVSLQVRVFTAAGGTVFQSSVTLKR